MMNSKLNEHKLQVWAMLSVGIIAVLAPLAADAVRWAGPVGGMA